MRLSLSRWQRVALGALALVVLRGSSCVRVDRPYAAPSADQLVAAVQARGRALRTLRAETRMGQKTNQGEVKATVRMMLGPGGKLRVDAVSPFDTPLSTLVSDGSRFALVDAQQNRYYHGPASPCNLARLLQVSLPAEAILLALGGATPLIGHRTAHVRWDDHAGQEVLTLTGDTLTQTVRLERARRGKDFDVVLSEIHDKQGLLLRLESRDYRQIGTLRLPRRLLLAQPRQKSQLRVEFSRQEPNVTLPDEAFVLPAAGGLPSQRVDCTPRGG